MEPPEHLRMEEEDTCDIPPNEMLLSSTTITDRIKQQRNLIHITNPLIGGDVNLHSTIQNNQNNCCGNLVEEVIDVEQVERIHQNRNNVSPSALTPADMEIWNSLQRGLQNKKLDRKFSFSSLIDSDIISVPSLLYELSDHDFEINAPINEIMMLQGVDLIKALDGSTNSSMQNHQ